MHTARGAASRAVRAPPAVGMWPQSPPAGLALLGCAGRRSARGRVPHEVLGAPPCHQRQGCVARQIFLCVPPHARSPVHPFPTTLPQGPLRRVFRDEAVRMGHLVVQYLEGFGRHHNSLRPAPEAGVSQIEAKVGKVPLGGGRPRTLLFHTGISHDTGHDRGESFPPFFLSLPAPAEGLVDNRCRGGWPRHRRAGIGVRSAS